MTRVQVEGYRGIFRAVSFRRFWLGSTFSLLGDAMTRVALTWFVYEATRSPEALGWLMLCYTGPTIAGGILAGAVLDRFDRRTVMIVDSLVRGAIMAGIPALHAAGRLSLGYVYVAAAVYGLLRMIPLAGGPALVPDLVRPQHLATANALEMLSFTLAGVIGPPLAGLLAVRIGAPNVVIIDAISYLAFALALAGVRPVNPQSAPGQADGSRAHPGHALRLLLGNRVLLATTLMFMAFNIGNGFIPVWLPILADQGLGGGADLYGTLLGVQAVGEVASALLAGSVVLPLSLGTLICLAQFLAGGALLIVLLGQTVWSTGTGLVLFGALSTPLTIWAQTLRMRIIPGHLRGRAFALLRTLMQAGAPLGGALAGWLLPVLGIPTLIALSTTIVSLPGLLGYRVRELRDSESP